MFDKAMLTEAGADLNYTLIRESTTCVWSFHTSV